MIWTNGALSPALSLTCGVPQGSILGPLLYILFTNEIPDLVHEHEVNFMAPTPCCTECGSTISYVDDSTYNSHGDTDPEQLSQNLNQQYGKISNFMTCNQYRQNNNGNKEDSKEKTGSIYTTGCFLMTE